MKPGAWSERRGHPPDAKRERSRQDVMEHLPSLLASDFVTGRWFGPMERGTYDPRKEVENHGGLLLVRQHERREVLPVIGESLLTIDTGIRRSEQRGGPGSPRVDRAIFFEYIPADAEDVSSSDVYAQMHLAVDSTTSFELVHRYVDVALRELKRGYGTRLWKTVESWLGQVAFFERKNVEVFLGVGQPNVMRWVEKMGFEVMEEDRELFERIQNEPEAFVEDGVYVSPESRARHIVKNPYLFDRSVDGRYMEDAVRLRYVKTIPVPEKI